MNIGRQWNNAFVKHHQFSWISVKAVKILDGWKIHKIMSRLWMKSNFMLKH